jgi:hypothetical protein
MANGPKCEDDNNKLTNRSVEMPLNLFFNRPTFEVHFTTGGFSHLLSSSAVFFTLTALSNTRYTNKIQHPK